MTEEEKQKAQRRARVFASDIMLYNDAKIVKGIEQDNFYESLKDVLDEQKAQYKESVKNIDPKVAEYFFDCAINDKILFKKAQVRSKIW